MRELRDLARQHPQVEYVPTVLNGEASDGICVGAIGQVVLERLPKLDGYRGFICGDPELVKMLKKRVILAGMGSREIYADAFLASPDGTTVK